MIGQNIKNILFWKKHIYTWKCSMNILPNGKVLFCLSGNNSRKYISRKIGGITIVWIHNIQTTQLLCTRTTFTSYHIYICSIKMYDIYIYIVYSSTNWLYTCSPTCIYVYRCLINKEMNLYVYKTWLVI